MDTATISYRVVDFLKKFPPFTSISDEDLLRLTAQGRVKFYERNEYLLWQGEPHRSQVFVIQQGTVSLWDESGEVTDLRDVRGAGDLLGIERYHDAPHVLYSARCESDVVVYAFSTYDFDALLASDERAERFVRAGRQVTLEGSGSLERRDPAQVYLHQFASNRDLIPCTVTDTVEQAANRFTTSGASALAVVDTDQRLRGVIDARTFVEWAASGVEPSRPVGSLLRGAPLVAGPETTVADGVLALGEGESPAIAITHDGSSEGRVQALVTPGGLGAVFGEDPAVLLHDIRHAATLRALADLNARARDFTAKQLTSPAAVDWLARFIHAADSAIVGRMLSLTGGARADQCWCVWGVAGRSESLTGIIPRLVLIARDAAAAGAELSRATDALAACGYLPASGSLFEPSFYAASIDEWIGRYTRWISDPVIEQTYRARALFDLRYLHGDKDLWTRINDVVAATLDRNFQFIMANDCLNTLPPLTFFEDAVVDTAGEQTSVFLLDQQALRPLVDVGRVLGMALGLPLGRSTIERFTAARKRMPDHEALFREAADTLRVVLWQQGRVGLSQGTSGAELPPSLLSRHDRQVLKGGFRSILQLLQFAANPAWLTAL